jgi:tRNA(fMet)-specific endonuclease VapC
VGTVIDTSVVVAIERALMEPGSVNLETLPRDCLIPSIVLMELRVGALLADTEARRLARERFASDLCEAFPIGAFGAAEARVAADVLVDLRRRGLTIGERDLLIAATALAGGHGVMTLNIAEFQRVPSLLPPPSSPAPPR